MDTEIIKQYVENSLTRLNFIGLMKLPHTNIPVEMIDKSVEQESDWIPWKSILSLVTDADLEELELKIGFKYPDSSLFLQKQFQTLH